MALPQLNTAPKYQLKVPSTGKEVRFRPFLVKEQKVLLIAYESQDRKAIIQSMLDTIKSCVDEVDVKKLTTFDVDYMFTQIRAKSVGESVDLNMSCTECETNNEVKINLEEVKMEVTKKDMIVPITDKISIKLKYPDYSFFIKNSKIVESESQADVMIDVVMSCIDAIQTEDESINIADEPREEVEKFIESLTTSQFEKISNFVQDLPKMTHEVKFTCANCQHENTKILEGLEDFF